MTDKSQIEKDARALFVAGADSDRLLGLMRERGLGPMDSFLLLCKITGMPFREAKEAMLNGKTWDDQRENFIALNEALIEGLRQLSEEFRDTDFKVKVIVREEDDSD